MNISDVDNVIEYRALSVVSKWFLPVLGSIVIYELVGQPASIDTLSRRQHGSEQAILSRS